MGHTAIKISTDLADTARSAAKSAHRSLTGQIEHWATLGKAIEPVFPSSAIAALKKSGGDPDSLADPKERALVLEVLENLRKNPPFAQTAAAIADTIGPRYEANPEDPEGVIQILPDGSRQPGRFVGRIFTPTS